MLVPIIIVTVWVEGRYQTRRRIYALVSLLCILLAVYATEYLFFERPSIRVSAVGTAGHLGVYWDRNCTRQVNTIDWGVLSVGETKEFSVYARNEGNETCILYLTTLNWYPNNAPEHLFFSWSCGDKKMEVGEIVIVTQQLRVPTGTIGFSEFRFDILFEGRKYYLGDINRDSIVNMKDLEEVCYVFGTTPRSPNWNPDADLNMDGTVNLRDIGMVCDDFGKH